MQPNVSYINQHACNHFEVWHSELSISQPQSSGMQFSTKFISCIIQRPKFNAMKHTLQLKMFPNAENVSYIALLSILLSKFFMKTFPTPDLRSEGSRWDHIMRMGRPFIMSKFMVSRARSAKRNKQVNRLQRTLTKNHRNLWDLSKILKMFY